MGRAICAMYGQRARGERNGQRATGKTAGGNRARGQGAAKREDAREGRGPLQGLAAGLSAVDGRAEVAYVSSTDVPLLHPAFVRAVVRAVDDGTDVALPQVHGHPQPLSAAYRTALLSRVEELVA